MLFKVDVPSSFAAPKKAAPISEVVGFLKLRLFDNTINEVEHPNILIAGCGTGQHSIDTAARFKNYKVFAIDLSLSSLACTVEPQGHGPGIPDHGSRAERLGPRGFNIGNTKLLEWSFVRLAHLYSHLNFKLNRAAALTEWRPWTVAQKRGVGVYSMIPIIFRQKIIG